MGTRGIRGGKPQELKTTEFKKTGLLTELTVADIQTALVKSEIWKYREHVFVPNVSFGFLPYEADLLIMNCKSARVTEIEIKRSWTDFIADFKKKHSHDACQISYFGFCVPKCMVEEVVKYYNEVIKENEKDLPNTEKTSFQLYSYDEKKNIYKEKCCDLSYLWNRRKLFIEEQLKLARLGCLRLWK